MLLPSQTTAPDASSSLGFWVTPVPSIRSYTSTAVDHRAAATSTPTSARHTRRSVCARVPTRPGPASSARSSTASTPGRSHGRRMAACPGSHRRTTTLMTRKATRASAGGQRDSPIGPSSSTAAAAAASPSTGTPDTAGIVAPGRPAPHHPVRMTPSPHAGANPWCPPSGHTPTPRPGGRGSKRPAPGRDAPPWRRTVGRCSHQPKRPRWTTRPSARRLASPGRFQRPAQPQAGSFIGAPIALHTRVPSFRLPPGPTAGSRATATSSAR